MGEQTEQLKRVSDRIGKAILSFQRIHPGQFHVDELRKYVIDTVGIVAPASPDRVLRLMRAEGVLSYVVVSRSQSLYEWRGISSGQEETN